MDFISIIVASHRPDYMPDLAELLVKAIQDDGNAEALIVCDYPVEEFQRAYPSLRWLYVADRSIPAKRNQGIQKSTGTVVGFLDDDCKPSSEWLIQARKYLAGHPSIAAVEGLTTIEKVDHAPPHYQQFKRLERRGFRTNNIFYRKDVLAKVGGFDERFTVQREDLDLAFTVLEMGLRIDFSETIEVMHRFRPEEKWDLLKNCWNRRFDPLLYKKHPHAYRTYVKTPVTPRILVMGVLHIGVAAIALCLPAFLLFAAGIDLTGAVLVSRPWKGGWRNPMNNIRHLVSFLCAPFVMAAALIYGNVRWKSMLIY